MATSTSANMSGITRTEVPPRRRTRPASSSSRMRPFTASQELMPVSSPTAASKSGSSSRTGWKTASATSTERRSAASDPPLDPVIWSANRRKTSRRRAASEVKVLPFSSPRRNKSAATTAMNGQSRLTAASWRVNGSWGERDIRPATSSAASVSDRSSSSHCVVACGAWLSRQISASSSTLPYGLVAKSTLAPGRDCQSWETIPATRLVSWASSRQPPVSRSGADGRSHLPPAAARWPGTGRGDRCSRCGTRPPRATWTCRYPHVR